MMKLVPILLLSVVPGLNLAAGDTLPTARERPYESPVQVQVNITRPDFDGRAITLAAGGDLQAAIDAANPGDVIELEPGAVFTGTFTLPLKDNPDAG